jgi:hypothetical protein
MLPPIAPTNGYYPVSRVPNLSRITLWEGDFVIEEPRLIATSTPWQNDKSKPPTINTLAAFPNMGNRLENKPLGGKVTVVVHCEGDFLELHTRCLESIVSSVPVHRRDLRIILNGVGPATTCYAEDIKEATLYKHEESIQKYPAMREVFYDEKKPIDTNYIVWFDDTSYAQHGDWLNKLAEEILKQPLIVGMYGLQYYRRVQPGELAFEWIRSRSWFRDKSLRNASGVATPNGDTIHFVPGWFWAIRTDVMKQCDIPCTSLLSHGDVVIGEQLHQCGYKQKVFNAGKSLVFQPPVKVLPKRNGDTKFPWE